MARGSKPLARRAPRGKADPMNPWPVLNSYTGEKLARVALPVGGIGTGTVSLCGWGAWRHWEVANRPAKGFTPVGQGKSSPFFALRAQRRGAAAVTRLLEGPLPVGEWEGEEGSPAPLAGLPRFRRCTFHAAYPLAQVALAAEDHAPLRAVLADGDVVIDGVALVKDLLICGGLERLGRKKAKEAEQDNAD